jgi:hypothetical protein
VEKNTTVVMCGGEPVSLWARTARFKHEVSLAALRLL